MGIAIRTNLNDALGAIATGQGNNLQLIASAEMLLDADNRLAGGDDLHGVRQLNRARTLLDFATGNDRTAQYATYRVSDAAQQKFGVAGDGTTFEGYQLVGIANRLAVEPKIDQDPNLHFLATISLQQADVERLAGHSELFLHSIDAAWDVLDYAKGVGEGMIAFGYDFATGIAQSVRHPIASASAVAAAVIHYDKTYDILVSKIQDVVDQYPGMSVEEKGQLHGRIAAELGSMFLGVGALRRIGATE